MTRVAFDLPECEKPLEKTRKNEKKRDQKKKKNKENCKKKKKSTQNNSRKKTKKIKKGEKLETLDPKGRTPHFRRLPCEYPTKKSMFIVVEIEELNLNFFQKNYKSAFV